MRPGPARGDRLERTLTVDPGMTASIGEREIHPVLGTVPLVSQMEEICREMLEPHLEDDEEGVGYALSVEHRSPAPVGAEVTLTAEAAAVDAKRLLCEVTVRDGTGRLVATGSFEQRVVPADEFAAQLDDLRGELAAEPGG